MEWSDIQSINGYVIFMILGYLLSTEDISEKYRKVIYAIGIMGGITRYVGIYLLSMRDGAINGIFFSYVQIHSFALATAIFIFFKYINWDRIFRENDPKMDCTDIWM